MINDEAAYTKYVITKMGFREGIASSFSLAIPFIQTLIDLDDQRNFVCTMLAFESKAYEECVKTGKAPLPRLSDNATTLMFLN
jgi:hypothetical protein